MAKRTYLDGQMLIAMPGIGDPRFERSVIYICAHNDSGAMGIIVNKTAPLMLFSDLVSQLNIPAAAEVHEPPPALMNLPVLFGGPVEQNRGFVLHSKDYFAANVSMGVQADVALTATVEVLEAMLKGVGPRQAALALGYSGWVGGQLEDEIKHNGWLTCEADEQLLFGFEYDAKYAHALGKIGVDPSMLSSEAGHG